MLTIGLSSGAATLTSVVGLSHGGAEFLNQSDKSMWLPALLFLLAFCLSMFSMQSGAAVWAPISRLLNDGTTCTTVTNLMSRWNNTAKQVEVCYFQGGVGSWSPAVSPSGGGGSNIGGGYTTTDAGAGPQCATATPNGYISSANPTTGSCSCPVGYSAAVVSATDNPGWGGAVPYATRGYLCYK